MHPSVCNGLDVEAASVSINRWMDKEDIADIYNAIVLSHKREWNFAICSNIDGLGGHYAKWNKSEEDKYSMIITYLWNLENKLVNITKNSPRFKDIENKLVGTSEEKEKGRGNRGVGY